jgi:transcriptional regulator
LCPFEWPSGYRPSRLAPALLSEMLAEIVAFEVVVERIVGKFKLSRNRSPEDRNRAMSALATRASSEDLRVLEWMQRVLG